MGKGKVAKRVSKAGIRKLENIYGSRLPVLSHGINCTSMLLLEQTKPDLLAELVYSIQLQTQDTSHFLRVVSKNKNHKTLWKN